VFPKRGHTDWNQVRQQVNAGDPSDSVVQGRSARPVTPLPLKANMHGFTRDQRLDSRWQRTGARNISETSIRRRSPGTQVRWRSAQFGRASTTHALLGLEPAHRSALRQDPGGHLHVFEEHDDPAHQCHSCWSPPGTTTKKEQPLKTARDAALRARCRRHNQEVLSMHVADPSTAKTFDAMGTLLLADRDPHSHHPLQSSGLIGNWRMCSPSTKRGSAHFWTRRRPQRVAAAHSRSSQRKSCRSKADHIAERVGFGLSQERSAPRRPSRSCAQCRPVRARGHPIMVMKTLDHWPDTGSDLDLLVTAPEQTCVPHF